jgi:hypothetical protein
VAAVRPQVDLVQAVSGLRHAATIIRRPSPGGPRAASTPGRTSSAA